MKAKVILASLVLMATAVPIFAGSNNAPQQSSVTSTISAQADPASDSPSTAPTTLSATPDKIVTPATSPVIQPSPSPAPSIATQTATEPEIPTIEQPPVEQPAPVTIDHCESRHELTGKADPKYEVWYDCYMSDGSVDQQLKGYSNSKLISVAP